MVWEYQRSECLDKMLKEAIRCHYQNFKDGIIDKSCMPMYLFLSGAGTGKSRSAAEFSRTAVNCLDDGEDEELRERLRNAWVFHTTFENGTSLRQHEQEGFHAVGIRMLYQLLREDFGAIMDKYRAPDPEVVLKLVAKGANKVLKDVTVILVVDGLQALEGDGHNKDSPIYRTLATIGDLTQKGAFLLPCCTATVSVSARQFFAHSSRLRVYLPLTPLKPPTILTDGISVPVFEKDDLVETLLDDCGGHGRAIEILWHLISQIPSWRDNISDFMERLRSALLGQYENALRATDAEKSFIISTVLSHTRLQLDKRIPSLEKTPDELAGPGLMWYEDVLDFCGYLRVPYILLWMWARRSNGVLGGFGFDDYSELSALANPTLPSKCDWQNFEKFVARFRCLKSKVLEENHQTSISKIHCGARLNQDVNIMFKNHHLTAILASSQLPTHTTKGNRHRWMVNSHAGVIDIRRHEHIVLNARNADSGDAVLSLDAKVVINEVHQYKYYGKNSPFTQQHYEDEWQKSASKEDFFMLFTTKEKLKIKLPKNCGLVSGDEWRRYFGPFSGRAFRLHTMYGNRTSSNSLKVATRPRSHTVNFKVMLLLYRRILSHC